ncbi:YncE family protein [Mycobacterium sp. 4858]|uniref:YncE family protein n=1 Tax=Mycobacterium sp. 4858 TaxID=2057185 RepID=UPI001304F990|nr:hypothetical protein [Mycobacterium sp. 4858]
MSRRRITNAAKAARANKAPSATGDHHADKPGHQAEIAAWLSAGALTLGVGAALASAGYVIDSSGNTVTAVNTATDKVITTIPTGSEPPGLAVSPDGAELYITDYGDNTASMISV